MPGLALVEQRYFVRTFQASDSHNRVGVQFHDGYPAASPVRSMPKSDHLYPPALDAESARRAGAPCAAVAPRAGLEVLSAEPGRND